MRSYDRIFVDSATTSEYNEGGSEVALVRSRADDKDILQFLSRARQLLISGDYVFVSRMKNLQALAQHGLTIQDAKDEILNLSIRDYYKGPKQDFDPGQPGDVWEFKTLVDGKQFYVKLKIQCRNGKEILKCLSFHEDEFV